MKKNIVGSVDVRGVSGQRAIKNGRVPNVNKLLMKIIYKVVSHF